jgi:arginine repressor
MAHMKPSSATISRVMAVLGAIKTKKKAASSSKNLAKARAVWAKQRKIDTRSNG